MTGIPESALAAVGKTVTAEDVVTAWPVAAMMATFGRVGPPPADGDVLPPLWHGMFCTATLPPEKLGADGMARDEPLLPEIPGYPRKLFGGARYRIERPLRIGEAIRRESSVAAIEARQGRGGAFLLARVEHRITGPGGPAVVEENDVIYRPAAGAASASSAPPPPEPMGGVVWRRTVDPGPVLMFRHSALTFNAHRVHYDRDYARANGLPGLLVQGTLIARLMLELIHGERPDAEIVSFAFRAGRPLYDTAPFAIEAAPAADGRDIDLRALAPDGAVAMTATASVRV